MQSVPRSVKLSVGKSGSAILTNKCWQPPAYTTAVYVRVGEWWPNAACACCKATGKEAVHAGDAHVAGGVQKAKQFVCLRAEANE